MRVVVVGYLSAHLRHGRSGGRRPHELRGALVVEKANDGTHALSVERAQVDRVVVRCHLALQAVVRKGGRPIVHVRQLWDTRVMCAECVGTGVTVVLANQGLDGRCSG